MNVVVDPSPVKLSTVLSVRSKLGATSPMNEPNTLSVATGAVLNTIVESASTPYPTVGLDVSCGCCITPLIDKLICAARLIFDFIPLV